MPLPEITWGCDPEFFAQREGAYIPAWEIEGLGDKNRPVMLNDNWGVLADGAAVEFNCVRPFENPLIMRNELRQVMAEWSEKARCYLVPKKAVLSDALWKHWDHPEMKRIGCDPDLDAHEQGTHRMIGPENLYFDGEPKQPFRTTGGHIHIGIDPWPEIPKHVFVRLLDHIYFYNFSHSPIPNWASIYRRAGLYRDKPYGLEYRTPASFWAHSDYETNFVRFIASVQDLIVTISEPGSRDFEKLVEAYKEANAMGVYNKTTYEPHSLAKKLIQGAIRKGAYTKGIMDVAIRNEPDIPPMHPLRERVMVNPDIVERLNRARAQQDVGRFVAMDEAVEVNAAWVFPDDPHNPRR